MLQTRNILEQESSQLASSQLCREVQIYSNIV